MIKREPTIEEFSKHVVEHRMTVAHDASLHRHITFAEPDTGNRHFHITTWPGYLAISGDMGCYVFARLSDMFQFFRGDEINPQYWSEKLQTGRSEGVREFSPELYLDAINYDFEQWDFGRKTNNPQAAKWAARAELERSGLLQKPESLESAIRDAMDYECPITGSNFHDFYEHTLTDYTYHFIWCCRAIRWGIEQYDAAKAQAVAA